MQKLRVLIVEDDKDIRTILRATLQSKYDIEEACDGLDALEILEQFVPDMILCDIMMPVMNGFAFCVAVRKIAFFTKTPFIFLSALADREHIVKGYELGATQYITKPFEPERLLRMIEAEVKTYALTPTYLEPRQPLKATDKTPSIPLRILAIDDEQSTIELFRAWCKHLNAEYCEGNDGIAAIEKISRYQPDIVLLDIALPKISGIKILQSMRSSAHFRSTPVIVISARDSERDRKYALELGANAFLAKPVSEADFNHTLNEIMTHKEFEIQPKKLPYGDIYANDVLKAFDPFKTKKFELNLAPPQS